MSVFLTEYIKSVLARRAANIWDGREVRLVGDDIWPHN